MHKPVWFWKDLFPLVTQFCKREGVSFNEVVNLSVQNYLGSCSVNELRLKAKLTALLREEAELRRVSSCMLRSGAYLPSYAEKILKTQKGKPSPFMYSIGDGDKSLRVLNKEEEKVFRKICGRREEIAREVAGIQAELLKDTVPFKLESDDSESQACDSGKKETGKTIPTRERDM